jgi:hypothetical protein
MLENFPEEPPSRISADISAYCFFTFGIRFRAHQLYRLNFFGPHEWFGIFVVEADKLCNGQHQIRYAFEYIAANPFPGDLPKPPLGNIICGQDLLLQRRLDFDSFSGSKIFFPMRLISDIIAACMISDQFDCPLERQ